MSLHDKYNNVNVTEPRLDRTKYGASAGACTALAIAQLLGYSMIEGQVGITGYVDLRGQVHFVSEVRQKCAG